MTVPANDARDVDPETTIDICFSGLVDPRAVGNFDVSLSSGQNTFDTEQTLQLFPWRAPGRVDAFAEERWCPGSVLSIRNREPLVGGLRYRAQLRPSPIGWAGEGLDTTTPGWTANSEGERRLFVEFIVRDDDSSDSSATGDDDTSATIDGGSSSTGDDGDSGPTNDPSDPSDPSDPNDPNDPGAAARGPALTDLYAPGQVFDPALGRCSCHVAGDALALARLDLSTPQRAWAGLMLTTTAAATGFPMVSPRRPSSSHLAHVLLRESDGSAIRGILGAPMPPEASLPYPELVTIARWIADGARFE